MRPSYPYTRSERRGGARAASRYVVLVTLLFATLGVAVAGIHASSTGTAEPQPQTLFAVEPPADQAATLLLPIASTSAAPTAVSDARIAAPTAAGATVPLLTPAIEQATPSATATPTPTAISTATAAPSPTATPIPPTPTPRTIVVGVTSLERPMFDAHNAERAAAGIAPLVLDSRLVAVARLRSKDMIEKRYFEHTSPSGETAFTLMKSAGTSYQLAAENIAFNTYPDGQTLQVAMNGLMSSPNHRANILRADFKRIGIGVASDGESKYYTIVFTAP